MRSNYGSEYSLDLADTAGSLKRFQLCRTIDYHDLCQFSVLQVFQAGSLFTCADAAADYRLLLCRVIGNHQLVFLFTESKHVLHALCYFSMRIILRKRAMSIAPLRSCLKYDPTYQWDVKALHNNLLLFHSRKHFSHICLETRTASCSQRFRWQSETPSCLAYAFCVRCRRFRFCFICCP